MPYLPNSSVNKLGNTRHHDCSCQCIAIMAPNSWV